MNHKNNTQSQRILDYLKNHHGITQIEAIRDLGILRLASRICELKEAGYPICGTMIDVTNRFGERCKVKEYRLQKGEENEQI